MPSAKYKQTFNKLSTEKIKCILKTDSNEVIIPFAMAKSSIEPLEKYKKSERSKHINLIYRWRWIKFCPGSYILEKMIPCYHLEQQQIIYRHKK